MEVYYLHLPANGTFSDMDKEPHKYIRQFYNPQRWIETTKNMRSFTIVLMYKHGRQHLQYDTTAFQEPLMSLRSPNIPPRDDFLQQKHKQWKKYFLNKYLEWTQDKGTYWFDVSIETDGVAVSLSIQRKRKIVEDSRRNITSRLSCEGDVVIGLDPVYRLVFGGAMQVYKSNSKTTYRKSRC